MKRLLEVGCWRASSAAMLLIAVGCGSSAKGGGSGGANNGDSGTGGSPSNSCPADVPGDGDACVLAADGFVRAHCSWGDDPRPQCRTTALCSQGEWQVTMPSDPNCADAPLPASCPTTPPTAGDTCADETLQCWYEEGERCWCSACTGGSEYPICQPISPAEWACSTPAAGCPNPLPQAGDACDNEDLFCGPNCEQPIRCRDGAWRYDQEMCPICASPDTLIATPNGERPIAELHEGDLVYSVENEAIVVVPILRTGSTPVFDHRVTRLVLDDGTVLNISPGHPTADGRLFSELSSGAKLDARHTVIDAQLVAYPHDRTYDILPASSSSAYFAGGVLIGSTLRGRGLSECLR